MVVSYEWHVPVDLEHENYGQFMCRFTKNPFSQLIFRLKYLFWHRWTAPSLRFSTTDEHAIHAGNGHGLNARVRQASTAARPFTVYYATSAFIVA